MRKKKFGNERGMTLVEVLVSLVILTILFTGAMQFFSQAYSYTSMNQNKTVGINVARNAMSFMEKQSFMEMKETFNKDSSKQLKIFICQNEYRYMDNLLPPPPCTLVSLNNTAFDITVLYGPESSADYDPYLIPITVQVDWERNGQDFSTSLEGTIASEDIRETR
jgi:prepilin-type N-terminal cleavage/methylation domain-containing protein